MDLTKDLNLWSEIRCGNKHALAQLYDLHVKALYNYGRKICPNTALVEDAIQDVFIDLWRYQQKLATPVSIRFYLYASLRRRIIKEDQRNASAIRFDFQWDDINLISLSEEARVIQHEEVHAQSQLLKYNLNNLSPRQYEAIVLRFYDELSYAEIADLMQVNEQSVRNLIQRGLEHLRQYARLVISSFVFLMSVL
ncbi:MAG TPA: sigma-70 family RNA polymerase sigma factor [Ohtaekwangia sp.]|uniref:RNA polymerase sigma factor n=1 Tax=Ohtaekwangia sp. TaxID=2066019 RepID=UPI002F932498